MIYQKTVTSIENNIKMNTFEIIKLEKHLRSTFKVLLNQ